jgi:SAM-dependent methyltransferase
MGRVTTPLDDVRAVLQCPRCGTRQFVRDGDGFGCTSCSAQFPFDEGVLLVPRDNEPSSVTAERLAARSTERRPDLGGIRAPFDELHLATGPLREALLALPFGDASAFFEEEGYFRNVKSGAGSFAFILDHVSLKPGSLHLDLGADCTWSTAHFARRGLRSIALDINHHLKASRLYAERFGIDYACVNADMHQACFADESFGLVTAFAVLHHSRRLGELARNLFRMTRPGGEVAFVEPFCTDERARERFGAAQKEMGIDEGVYTLQEWHAAFTEAGFDLAVSRVDTAFEAVYLRPLRHALDPFAHAYRHDLRPAGRDEAEARTGTQLEVPVIVRNAGTMAWHSEGEHPVFLSYHLRRSAPEGDVLVQFDNERSPIPPLAPGAAAVVPLRVLAPERPGRYVLDIDLVHEGVTWFAERDGAPARLRLVVAD